MSNAPPPSSLPPGVPPQNSNRSYAIVALLLLLAMGGLLFWKFRGSEPTAEVTPAPSATAAPTFNRQDDDIPPPPDPIPEAGPPEDAGGKRAPSSGGGCEARVCTEAPSAALQSALAMRGRQARRCYESQLANDPSLTVKMNLNVKIGTNGGVCSASVADSTNDSVARCVLNFYRSGGFPPSKGCIAELKVPLNYVPR